VSWEIKGKFLSIIALVVCAASSSLWALDRDGGNISDVWEAHHGYGPLISTADNDGDGIINLLEYYFDLNPLVSDANYLQIESVSSTSIEVSFLAPTGQRFKFTRTDDLVDAEWLDIEEGGEAVFFINNLNEKQAGYEHYRKKHEKAVKKSRSLHLPALFLVL